MLFGLLEKELLNLKKKKNNTSKKYAIAHSLDSTLAKKLN